MLRLELSDFWLLECVLLPPGPIFLSREIYHHGIVLEQRCEMELLQAYLEESSGEASISVSREAYPRTPLHLEVPLTIPMK